MASNVDTLETVMEKFKLNSGNIEDKKRIEEEYTLQKHSPEKLKESLIQSSYTKE